MKLFKHQEQALEKAREFDHVGFYLDMGLGKTFVGTEQMKIFNNSSNILICQNSKIDDWCEHFEKYTEYKVFKIKSKKDVDNYLAYKMQKNVFLQERYNNINKNKKHIDKNKNILYNSGMERRKQIDNSKISVASKALINKLSRKFRRRGGHLISDEDTINYLNSRNAEAVTLDAYTILIREKISISALIEELEHAEQYLRGENDGTPLSVAKNEILAKEKSIQDADRYKIPKKEVEFVKRDIEAYKKEYRRLRNENIKNL